jgi:putative oxidoreductase
VLRAVATKPFLPDLGILILRVFVGTLLIHHGYEKLANIENFADAFVRPLHLPFPILLSYTAAFSEVIGSWLLITGLMTRLGALAIMGTISVAIYHAIITAGFNIYLLDYWDFTSQQLSRFFRWDPDVFQSTSCLSVVLVLSS